jgi:hypothetical protein
MRANHWVLRIIALLGFLAVWTFPAQFAIFSFTDQLIVETDNCPRIDELGNALSNALGITAAFLFGVVFRSYEWRLMRLFGDKD